MDPFSITAIAASITTGLIFGGTFLLGSQVVKKSEDLISNVYTNIKNKVDPKDLKKKQKIEDDFLDGKRKLIETISK
jgi:hypothetical protein